MNFMRKSTDGWSVGFTLLDFSGGMANYAQMVLQSVDQRLFSPLPNSLAVSHSSLNFELTLITYIFHFQILGRTSMGI